jgi:hypothetical protein
VPGADRVGLAALLAQGQCPLDLEGFGQHVAAATHDQQSMVVRFRSSGANSGSQESPLKRLGILRNLAIRPALAGEVTIVIATRLSGQGMPCGFSQRPNSAVRAGRLDGQSQRWDVRVPKGRHRTAFYKVMFEAFFYFPMIPFFKYLRETSPDKASPCPR